MIFILFNWLFNGIVLSYFYIFGFVFYGAKSVPDWVFFALGFGTSGLLVIIGISQFGHAILRLFLGARASIGRERSKIEPILGEVLENINNQYGTTFKVDNLKLLVKDVKEPNAQAFGRDTIVVTDGLIRMASDDELRGVLAHEVGHLL